MTVSEKHVSGNEKVDVYRWQVADEPGEFRLIHKKYLHVDKAYQRDVASQNRVLQFSRDWSWIACGVLTVAQRSDGTYWLIDGQHRKLAADRRSDIHEMPCIVFTASHRGEEAAGFVRANVHRGPVKSLDQFKARLMSGDDLAISVNGMVESVGYRVANGGARYTVSCVAALMKEWERDAGVARQVWELCISIADGETVTRQVFSALCTLEHHLLRRGDGDSIFKANNASAIERLGMQAMVRAANNAVAYRGKGGEKVWADGVVTELNKGRRTRRIEPLF